MCGIAGFYGFDKKGLLKEMSHDMEHRGPDGEGFYEKDNAHMLSRRLAIIDRKGGDQPIYNEDKTVAVVFNGEIYNYKELRKELEKKGHVFKTVSDTEVIVHGFEEWGTQSFDRLNGMFGISLYDATKKELYVIRDHFGIKPLYYHVLQDKNKFQIIYASEIKPLLNSGLVKKAPNDKIIYRYLKYRIHDDSEETFFEDIYRIMPGEYLKITDKGMTKQRYSNLEQDLLNLKTKQFTPDDFDVFEKEFTNAVRIRLVSEVPVGTCLSGGLDSSAVVAVANNLLKAKAEEAGSLGAKQNTFSAVFPGSTNDEEAYVDAVTSKLNKVEIHKIFPKPEDFFKDLMDFVKFQEEPTISTGPYAQYQVMREAHKFVTVLLDGQGADEMMAGYIPYYFVYLRQLKAEKNYTTLVKEIISSRDILSKFAKTRIFYKLGLKKTVSPTSVLNDTFAQKYQSETFSVTQNNLKKRLVEDIFHNSLQSLLRYEDKNAMRFSIEGRVPFLDFNLVKTIFSLSDDAIINGGWNKYILRNAVRSVLPEKIVNRRNKIGFTTPEYEWFLHMKNRIYSIFLSESFASRKYFNQAEVLKAFEAFIQRKNEDTLIFWRIMNVELWLQTFIDEPKEAIPESKEEFFEPNPTKKTQIVWGKRTFNRYPLKTTPVTKDTKLNDFVLEYVQKAVAEAKKDKKYANIFTKKWTIVISEKIVAITQGRAYFIWDIKTSLAAKILANFVKKTPYGIGLGSPWTMQLAIQEAGLPRITFAAFASVLTKPFGVKGLFYRLAGSGVNSIDGPTEYSLYPSNVSAKLGPKDPDKVAKTLRQMIIKELPKSLSENFQGVTIIDANDLGRNILGENSKYSADEVAEMFRDNPLGQASECTPMALVTEE